MFVSQDLTEEKFDRVNIIDHAKFFLCLPNYGFNINGLKISVFEDEYEIRHLVDACPRVGKVKSVVSFDAVEFFETLAASSEVEVNVVETPEGIITYCWCYTSRTILNSRSRNIPAFAETPIVNFDEFSEASYDFYEFKKAVAALKGFEPALEPLHGFSFDEIFSIQEKRLKTAKEFFISNPSLVLEAFKEITDDAEVLNILNTASLDKLNVSAFDESQFDYQENLSEMSCPQREIINLIGFLYLDVDGKFFVAPEVFSQVYVFLLKKHFVINSVSVEVESNNFGEFMETLKVLYFSSFAVRNDSSSPCRVTGFDEVKVKEIVSSANILSNSK